ncbi:hypothetical protein VTH06DRAFT_4866 [Thermothelomyces fergusii]
MILSARASFAVLLAAAAQRGVAAPRQNNNGTAQQAPSNNEDGDGGGIVRVQTVANLAPAPSSIPPEALASQQSSAAAVASAVAAANEAAAASGLKELPGLQASESPASLLPLLTLATGDAIAPPAGEDSPPTVTSFPAQEASQSDVAQTRSSEGGLRPLPGLGAGAAIPSSLAPLPTPPSVDTSQVETATSGPAQIIGSLTEGVGESTAEAASSAAKATSAAGAAVGSFTPIAGDTTVAAVIGSFGPIAATPSSDSGATRPSAFVNPARGFVFTNGTSSGRGAAQATGATLLPLPLPSGAAGGSPGRGNSTAGGSSNTGISNGTIGEDGGSGGSSLRPLPNDPAATAGSGPEGDVAAETTPAEATSSALTTLTTVLADGATSTLVTAVAAAEQTAGGGGSVASATAGSGAEGRVEPRAGGAASGWASWSAPSG